MKRLIFVVLIACVAFVGCQAKEAEARGRRCKTPVVEAQDSHNVAGVKIDAPNLVKIDKEGKWTLGVEGGKDVLKEVFFNDFDFIEADKGYFAYVKVTYKGCLLRCGEE